MARAGIDPSGFELQHLYISESPTPIYARELGLIPAIAMNTFRLVQS